MVPDHLGLLLAELLARIKLDDLAARLGGLLNRLEDREVVEGISLAADEEAAAFAIIGDFLLGAQRKGRGENGGGETNAQRKDSF